MNYIINVSIILGACFLFYKLFLRRETFYRANRWVLIVCMLLAFCLPLIPVPAEWSWREPVKKSQTQIPVFIPPTKQSEAALPSSSNATETYFKSGVQTETVKASVDYFRILFYLYVAGVLIFGLNLLFQFIILLYQSYRRTAFIDGRFRIVETAGDRAPCSFGNTIFINPAKYDWQTYNQILLHEKIHCRQMHSIDIMLAEMMVVIQWFNPFAWFYRNEVESNIEFLTDDSVINTNGIEKKAYQLSLLKVSAPHLPLSLTINYNQSLLKKRITMMNVKKYSVKTVWKYFFLLPLFGMLMFALNQPAAVAQTTGLQKPRENKVSEQTSFVQQTQNETTPQNKQQVQQQQKAQKDQQTKNGQTVQMTSNVINPDDNRKTNINTETHHPLKREGTWFARLKKDQVCIDFKSDVEGKEWSSSTCFDKSEFPTLPASEFQLTREAGTISFKGKFDGDLGYGHFTFAPDESLRTYLKQHGVTDLGNDEDEMFSFFMVKMTKAYVAMLNEAGFKEISNNDLVAMCAMDVSGSFIKGWKEMGYNDLSTRDLISARALKIDGAYIKEISDAGYTKLAVNELISFKAIGINKAFIQEIKTSMSKLQSAESLPSPQDLISLKSLKIDPTYIKTFADAGYRDLSTNELFSLKSLGINVDFIKSFEALGYKNIPARTLISLKSIGVKPEFIKGFNKLGFSNIDLNEVTAMKSTGVTPEFVQSMKAKGFESKDLTKYIHLKNSWQ